MIKKVFLNIKELFLNFNTGMIAFLIHRVTGVALVAYLVLHIYTISPYRQGAAAFDASVGKYDNLFGHFMEYFLLCAVLFHLLNGIRLTISDFFNLSRFQEKMFVWCVVIFIVIAFYSIVVFFPEFV